MSILTVSILLILFLIVLGIKQTTNFVLLISCTYKRNEEGLVNFCAYNATINKR